MDLNKYEVVSDINHVAYEFLSVEQKYLVMSRMRMQINTQINPKVRLEQTSACQRQPLFAIAFHT